MTSNDDESGGVAIGNVDIPADAVFPTMLIVTREGTEEQESYICVSKLPFQMKDAIRVLVYAGQIT